jgi:hypothetical protein
LSAKQEDDRHTHDSAEDESQRPTIEAVAHAKDRAENSDYNENSKDTRLWASHMQRKLFTTHHGNRWGAIHYGLQRTGN